MENKKFKNSFCVKGTDTELFLFTNECEKLGWRKGSTCNIHKTNIIAFDKYNGTYDYMYDCAANNISTLQIHDYALGLAKEVVEDEKYFKLIGDLGAYPNTKPNYIYRLTDKPYVYTASFMQNKFTEDWQECTKEDYDRQELLEEAKRRYPIGTIVKELTVIGEEFVIEKHFDSVKYQDQVWFSAQGKMRKVNALVYKNGEWAKVVKNEPKFTIDEIYDII